MSLTSYRAAPPRDGGGPHKAGRLLLRTALGPGSKSVNGFFPFVTYSRRRQCLATTYSSNA